MGSVIIPPIDFSGLNNTSSGSLATINANLPLSYNSDTGDLSINNASLTSRGVITTETQSIAGKKTFSTGIASSIEPSSASDVATKSYVDARISTGTVWQTAVISFHTMNTSPPSTPSNGDRYICTDAGDNFTKNYIYEYSTGSSGWVETIVSIGFCVYCQYDTLIYVFTDDNIWSSIGASMDHYDLKHIGTLTHEQIDGYLNQDVKTTALPTFSKATISSTYDTTSTSTGAFFVSGGISASKSIYVGNALTVNGIVNINNTTNSTNTLTGSLIINGGACIAKNLYIDGSLNITNSTVSSSTTTGSVIIAGGLGVAGSIYSTENYVNGVAVSSVINDIITPEKYSCIAGTIDSLSNINGMLSTVGSAFYNPKVFGNGNKYYCSALPTNPLAIEFDHNCIIDIDKGSYPHNYVYNSYSYEEMIFGKEYIYDFINNMKKNIACNIIFSGDSTTSGAVVNTLRISEIFQNMCSAHGMTNITSINSGHSGESISDWVNTYLPADLIAYPSIQMYVIRWGLNDLNTANPNFSTINTNIRSGLTTLRAAYPVSSGTLLVVMSPNPAQHSYRDDYTLAKISRIWRRAAIEFNCLFIDTYGLFMNSKDGATLWFDDFSSTGYSSLHPQDNLNYQIISTLFNALFPKNILDELDYKLNEKQTGLTVIYPSDLLFYVSGTTKYANFSNIGCKGYSEDGTITLSGTSLFLDSDSYLLYSIDGLSFNNNYNVGTISFDLTPNYSGSPTTTNYLINIMDIPGSAKNQIYVQHARNGNLYYSIKNSSGVVIAGPSLGAWVPTAATTYNFELSFDVSNGSNMLFIDGVQKGSTNTSTGTRDGQIHQVWFGWTTNNGNFDISNVKIYNTCHHTANFTVSNFGTTSITNEQISMTTTTNSTSSTTGSLVLSGGAGISKDLYIGGNLTCIGNITGSLNVDYGTANSTTTSTGALVITGGVGIAKSLYVGQNNVSCYSSIVAPTGLCFEVSGEKSLYGEYSLCTSGTAANTSGTVAISSSLISISANAMCNWTIDSNCVSTNSMVGCVRAKITPSWSGNPSSSQPLLYVGALSTSDNNNRIYLFHSSSGNLTAQAYSSTGSQLYASVLGAWSPTATQEYDIEYDWDLTTGAGRVFVDGTQFGSTITTTGTRSTASINCVGYRTTNPIAIKYRYIQLFNTVQHTANFTVDSQTVEYPKLACTGILSITNSNNAYDISTGSLQIAGGACILKDMYLGGNLHVLSTTDSSSTTTGTVIISGGCGITKNVYVGGIVNSIITTESSSTTTGSVIISGGVSVAKKLYVGGVLNAVNTTVSSSTSTGALIISGGLGISGSIYTSTLNVISTTNTTDTLTGCMIVKGGIAIAKDIQCGGEIWANPHAFSVTASGAISGTLLGLIYLYGDCLHILFYELIAAAGAATTITTTALDVGFRPTGTRYGTVIVVDDSVNNIGTCSIASSGVMTFHVGGSSNFTNSNNAGIRSCSFNYIQT